MKSHPSIFNIAKAFLWRIMLERGKTIIIAPVAAIVLLAIFAIFTHSIPHLLTPQTMRALQAQALSYDILPQSHARLCAAVFTQAPFLVALIVAVSASFSSTALTTSETRRGTFEILLPYVHETSKIVGSLMLSIVGLCFVDWLLCTLPLAVLMLTTAFLADAWSLIDARLVLIGLTLPMPLAVLGAATGTALAIKYPWISQYRIGTGGNIMQLLNVLPTLAVFLYVTLNASTSIFSIMLFAWFISAIVFMFVAHALSASVKRVNFIGSQGA